MPTIRSALRACETLCVVKRTVRFSLARAMAASTSCWLSTSRAYVFKNSELERNFLTSIQPRTGLSKFANNH